jgi:hypothetical protein
MTSDRCHHVIGGRARRPNAMRPVACPTLAASSWGALDRLVVHGGGGLWDVSTGRHGRPLGSSGSMTSQRSTDNRGGDKTLAHHATPSGFCDTP